MIVLIGLCSALYTAVLLVFKPIAPIVPGYTEIRPAAALPIVFSIFFGPAAAWGSAFGNIIGDVLGGTIGPGSLFGIIGNFFYGYAPYRVFEAFQQREQPKWNRFVFVLAALLASTLCAAVIALGLEFFKLVPFEVLMIAITINNVLMSLFLAPLLILMLGKRIFQMRLDYKNILGEQNISRPLFGKAGPGLLLITIAVVSLMMFFSSFPLLSNRAFLLVLNLILILLSLVLL